jgi:hypothetical protein
MKPRKRDRQFSGFEGQWFTTFGPMTLEPDGAGVAGTYGSGARQGRLTGTTTGDRLEFSYEETDERGDGVFRLARPGKFIGSYRYTVSGESRTRRWEGERGWDGVWSSDFGRMRLIHEPGRIHGFYEGPGPSVIDGALRKGRLELRYREPAASGEARFELQEDGRAFAGEWRADGRSEWRPWTGRRLPAERGLTWLVVLEAHWQRSLAESEYAFGDMLREVFARLPGVRVRQRFFHDAASLEHWCRGLVYLPEPTILVIASHGVAEGLSVHGEVIDTARIVESLRYAESLRLLHFSSCLVAQDAARAIAPRSYPMSVHDARRLGARAARLHLSRPDAQSRTGSGGRGGKAADARQLRGRERAGGFALPGRRVSLLPGRGGLARCAGASRADSLQRARDFVDDVGSARGGQCPGQSCAIGLHQPVVAAKLRRAVPIDEFEQRLVRQHRSARDAALDAAGFERIPQQLGVDERVVVRAGQSLAHAGAILLLHLGERASILPDQRRSAVNQRRAIDALEQLEAFHRSPAMALLEVLAQRRHAAALDRLAAGAQALPFGERPLRRMVPDVVARQPRRGQHALERDGCV